MTAGAWIAVFVGIALAGLLMVACFGLWLWRKTNALLRETGALLDRAGELMGLLDQIELPDQIGPREEGLLVTTFGDRGDDGDRGGAEVEIGVERGPAT